VSAIGISRREHFVQASDSGKLTNMKNTVDPWAGRMGAESALLRATDSPDPTHHRMARKGSLLFSITSNTKDSRPRSTAKHWSEICPTKGLHYRILDCGMKSFRSKRSVTRRSPR